MEENRKGQRCPHEQLLCQEGYCSECALSPSSKLKVAVGKRNEERVRLEKTIVALVKEHYRLLGIPYYENTTKELDVMIKGGDDGSFRRGISSNNPGSY